MRFVDVSKKLESTSTILFSATTLIAFSIFTDCTLAQIEADTTLGTDNSQVTPNVTIKENSAIRVDGGAKRGGNLFHSFEKFNVNNDQRVYFANPDGVQNILSRVSGNTRSEINGTVGVLGNANLFLINPNGIIFGPNAALDVNGSFLASTADSFVFNNGFQFSATDSKAPPLLTVNVPIGLQFGKFANSIVNQSALDNSSLQVQPGNTLALVGGDVSLQGGTLIALDGRIEIGSVARRSLVKLLPIENGWTLNYQQVQNFLDVELVKDSQNNSSSVIAFNIPESSNRRNGEVSIQGRDITLADKSTVAANRVVTANASGTLTMVDSAEIFTEAVSTEDGGDVIINAEKLILRQGALISTSVTGVIKEDETIASASGNGGDILVNAESIELIDNSKLLSLTEGFGDAGDIRINTRRLAVKNRALILAESTGVNANGQPLETGRGGNIEIVDAESVEVLNNSSISSQTINLGDEAGNLRIETNDLVVQDGASISAATFGTGDAGSLVVRAGSIELSGASDKGLSGLFANAIEETGNGGNLDIFTDELIVRDGATVSVSNFQSRNLGLPGSGSPGNLNIKADAILLDEGTITAETAAGDQGNITLKASNLVLREGSRITTDSLNTTGGNIFIDTDLLIASDDSDITANAQRGAGGRVTINAEGIFGIQAREQLTPESDITASSELGVEFSGEVTLNTPNIDLSSALVELPTAPIETEVVQACAPSDVEEQSEFIITGRGGLPPTPREVLTINPIEADWVIAPEETRSRPKVSVNPTASPPAQIVEAQGWTVDDNGEVWFVASASTAPPRSSWQHSPSCHSHEIN